MKRRNVERLFYVITGVLMITLWGTMIVTNDNYMELLEVNETLLGNNDTLQKNIEGLQEENLQLTNTINVNRVTYNDNLESLEEEMTYYKDMYYDLYNEYREILDSRCKYPISIRELDLLVKCVEVEAGVGNMESQRYVTQVIINRLKSSEFPNSIGDIIYQKNKNIPQFSSAYNGAMDKCNPQDETYINVMTALLLGTELPEYVLYFHSDSVKRNWVNTLNTYTIIQGTVFAYEERSINNE